MASKGKTIEAWWVSALPAALFLLAGVSKLPGTEAFTMTLLLLAGAAAYSEAVVAPSGGGKRLVMVAFS